jgi:C_GCAxxG_C_C family probable redox protein
MKERISLRKVKEDAEGLVRSGGFLCPEAVVVSVRENVAPEMPKALISAASGFPGGVGRSKCLCGAVAGGVLCIGYFFGRTEPSNRDDPKSQRAVKLAGELQEYFRSNHKGVLCCSVYIEGLDVAAGEHKPQCIGFTGEMARKTAEIAARELGLEIEG